MDEGNDDVLGELLLGLGRLGEGGELQGRFRQVVLGCRLRAGQDSRHHRGTRPSVRLKRSPAYPQPHQQRRDDKVTHHEQDDDGQHIQTVKAEMHPQYENREGRFGDEVKCQGTTTGLDTSLFDCLSRGA